MRAWVWRLALVAVIALALLSAGPDPGRLTLAVFALTGAVGLAFATAGWLGGADNAWEARRAELTAAGDLDALVAHFGCMPWRVRAWRRYARNRAIADYELADLRLERGDLDGAQALLDRWLDSRQAGRTFGLAVRAQLERERGDRAAAEASAAALEALAGKARGLRAAFALQDGRWADAEALCLAVLDDVPGNFAALAMCVEARSALGRFDEALALLDGPIKQFEDYCSADELRLLRASAPRLLDALHREQASLIAPGLALLRISVLHDAGQLARARRLLVDGQPSGGRLPLRIAWARVAAVIAAASGQQQAARRHLDEAASLAEPYAGARATRFGDALARASALRLLGRATEAYAAAQEARDLALHPAEHHQAHWSLGRCAEAAGDASAAAHYEAVLASGIAGWRTEDARARQTALS